MTELADRLHCTGCGACQAVCRQGCISMASDEEGFPHPVLDRSSCVECGLCALACPVLHPVPADAPKQVFAAWSAEEDVRTRSSSGGLSFELGKEMIGRGGVVCGAVLDASGVHHACVQTLSGLEAMRGSKYVQSDLRDVYGEVASFLKDGRPVLFSGTPCQVAGLRKSLGKQDDAMLYTVDLVCHGVPSPRIFSQYMDTLRRKYGDFSLSDFRFRSSDRWDFLSYVGDRRLPSRDDAFMQLYLEGFLHREACYRCPFARKERVGDLTLGDFWGIGAETPLDGDPGRGCSLVLVGNEKGRTLLDAVRPRLFCRERSLDEACRQNSNLTVPSRRPRSRDGIYRRIFRDGFGREYRKLRFRRFWETAYVRLHHVLHLAKTRICRKSA